MKASVILKKMMKEKVINDLEEVIIRRIIRIQTADPDLSEVQGEALSYQIRILCEYPVKEAHIASLPIITWLDSIVAIQLLEKLLGSKADT